MIKDNIQKKTLSIRISTDGFCFCSYTATQTESLQYYCYPTDRNISLAANLKKAIEESPLITKDTEYSVKAIIETNEFTTIPEEFDNKQDYKIYYRHCFPKNGHNMEIVANKFNAQGVTIIFPVEKNVSGLLQQIGEVTFYTPVSIMLGFLTLAAPEEERFILAYVQENSTLLLSIKNGRMELANTFTSENREDILFYLLSIWKEQGLSQTEDTLYICGDREVNELLPQLKRFIKQCKRLNPNEQFTASLLNRIEGIPFDLQALILCE